jgi:hypothetical protein
MPTLKMAKRIFFRPLIEMLSKHPLVDSIDKTECLIRIKGNRPDIVCIGLNHDDGEGARGYRIYKAKLDEYQGIKRHIFDEIIRPALADTPGSGATFTGTPKGKLNSLYDVAMRSQTNESWAYFHYLTIDNPTIPDLREEVEAARASLDPRLFRQEYEASFEDFPGKVFTEMSDRHLVSEIPTFKRVFAGIDWGDINPAVAVIGMTEAGKYFLVDSWENNTGLPVVGEVFYGHIARLFKKWDVWRAFADPSRPAAIEEVRRYGKHHGVKGMERTIRAFNRIAEGCQIVNNLFYKDKFYLHVSQRHTYEKMQSYHREIDDDGTTVLEAIEDGQDDHTTDATRYCIATLEAKHDLTAIGA